jgi:hypothetical protein
MVASAAVLIYAPAWSYDFTYLDDHQLILDQQSFLQNPSSLYRVFARSYFGGSSHTYYRPLVNLSLVLDARWTGTRPFGYHFTNVALHATACLLLLRLLLELGTTKLPSLCAALLFAAHPVHAASVAWIPGRNDLLLGGFVLSACLLLARDRRHPTLISKMGHLACVLGALFSKETALCLPLLFLACLWALGPPATDIDAPDTRARRIRSTKEQLVSPHLPRFGRLLAARGILGEPWMWAGWAASVALYAVARSAVLAGPSPVDALGVERMIESWPILVSDLGKLSLPVGLQVLAAPADIRAYSGAGGVLLLGILILLGLRCGMRPRVVTFGLVLVLCPLLAGLVGAKVVVLENRLYLAAAGTSVLLGEGLRAVRAWRPRWGHRFVAAGLVIPLAFGVAALRHSTNFRDRDRFSQAAIAASPHSGIAANLINRRVVPRPPTSTGW